jgi:hypothetical protein
MVKGQQRSILKIQKPAGTLIKGSKLEIFGFRVFSQIRPVWVDDLGTRQKNSKF